MARLPETRFGLAEHKRNVFVAIPPDGTPYEEVLGASYFANLAKRIQIGDRIEVMPEDGSYFAELAVVYVETMTVKTVELRKISLEVEIEAESPDFEIAWKGPHKKHSVVRRADKEIVKGGFATKDAAAVYLASHLKALAR